MPAHILDNPIWAALAGPQRGLAEGAGAALRYPPAMAPFAGLRAPDEAGFSALRALLLPGEAAALFTAPRLPAPPSSLGVAREAELGQMVAGALPPVPAGELSPLTPEDAPAMRRLAELAKPGPFGPRTHELGGFVGVWEGGELIAMAGERFRLPGYAEVSAVATHPAHRGRGLARLVTAAVMHGVAARGETAFLHVFSDNAPAIALYRGLGMLTRCVVHLTVLRRLED